MWSCDEDVDRPTATDLSYTYVFTVSLGNSSWALCFDLIVMHDSLGHGEQSERTEKVAPS